MDFKKCTKEGFEIITPQRAKELLGNNYENNRRINNVHVATIKEDIVSGNWNPIRSYWSDCFVISEDGKLLNGQHRCSAIVSANKSVKVWVKYGAPEEIYKYLDDGKKRSVADIANVSNSTSISTIAGFACCIEDGDTTILSTLQHKFSHDGTKGGSNPSKQMILSKIEKNNAFYQECFHAGTMLKKVLPFSVSRTAQVYYFLSKVMDTEFAKLFYEELASEYSNYQVINAYKKYVYSCVIKKRNMTFQWIFTSMVYTYFKFINNEKVLSFNNIDKVIPELNNLLFAKREEWKNE